MNGMNKDLIQVFKEGCLTAPLMKPSKYAEHVGVSPATVTGQMDRGEIPFVTLTPAIPGKRPSRYINLVALYQRCKDAADADRKQAEEAGRYVA